ncbi:hypothetical protein Moror_2744 [Moniliophthora roreri MCA 2997]|uniref:Uncharacterized protein n=1 Tax=Moniliophthora roreri (strain MCA 2997) TaxID=1381753 RepID=V2XCF1_MONRO|nr:hypothetical protein Moror_2744 [Moniliophthora roreri MCA 2997]
MNNNSKPQLEVLEEEGLLKVANRAFDDFHGSIDEQTRHKIRWGTGPRTSSKKQPKPRRRSKSNSFTSQIQKRECENSQQSSSSDATIRGNSSFGAKIQQVIIAKRYRRRLHFHMVHHVHILSLTKFQRELSTNHNGGRDPIATTHIFMIHSPTAG